MLKIFHAILFSILLIILAFCDNSKAADGVNEITELEESNASKDAHQNQIEIIEEIDKGNGWMNKAKNMGLNSARKLTNYVKNALKIPFQNKINIEIGANIGTEMAKNMVEIGEIMKKILEIDVNVKIDSKKNGKNNGILMKLKLQNGQKGAVENRKIKISTLLDKHGKIKMNPIELGKQLIRQICGGNECDQPDDLPQFGANPSSVKPPPELHELDRSLRPMLLKLGSKFNTGRLWTDNPIPDYKNGFYVAFDWELMGNLPPIDSAAANSKIQNSEQYWHPVLKAQLDRFERNAPIRFVELQKNNKMLNASENGLQRNKEENNVFLDGKELQEGSLEIQEILLKALGVNAGEGLRVEYDRRDKFMPPLRRAFAQLNAAYGAENYEIAKKNKKLFDEVYANFAKNSVIQFVVHEEAPKDKSYVRIYHDDNDDSSNATVGHPTKRDSSYQGEKMEFGKNLMTSRHALYHEFMHVAGMEHEHQRADVEQFLKIDHEKGQKMLQMSKGEYAINYMPDATYLPINEYNPRSIMHYDMNWEFFEPNSEKAKQHKNQQMPTEPDQIDWENLNHFYGVGKGRTQFKVEMGENGHPKIVNDIDGMRRL